MYLFSFFRNELPLDIIPARQCPRGSLNVIASDWKRCYMARIFNVILAKGGNPEKL
ncbi:MULTISPECIES: hypothetical protein [unclassified Rickettsia]|uniref:hypothetical protein n=1 Tax=unclassified Rickettsia TaxID=114295 RepID=UPI003132A099